MGLYRERTPVLEAYQVLADPHEPHLAAKSSLAYLSGWMGSHGLTDYEVTDLGIMLGGRYLVKPGDWIIRYGESYFYRCRGGVFVDAYVRVD